MRNSIITVILIVTVCISGCQRENLQNIDFSEIQGIVLDSVIGMPSAWNQDSSKSDYRPILNINITDTLYLIKGVPKDDLFDFTKAVRKDDLFKIWRLDTTNLFLREEFNELVQENEIIVLKDSSERKLNFSSKNYILNNTKETQADYYSSDTIGSLTFFPMLYNRECTIAIQICSFHRSRDWGSGEAYFMKKINSIWTVVGSKRLWIS